VIKTIGMRDPSAFSFACSSRPDIPGIRMSATRKVVWCRWSASRNSSADPKHRADSPADSIRSLTALWTDRSSSTIATTCEILLLVIARICSTRRADTITHWVRPIGLWLHGIRQQWGVGLSPDIVAAQCGRPSLLGCFQPVRHSDQSSQRVGLQFCHHVAAMNFHRVFARAELRGYLFIEQA